MSWGALILGHAVPEVVAAVSKAAALGFSFGAPTESESDLATVISHAIPSMERLRLVSSGTEATMSAIRLSRGFTGRDKIIKFDGCYHGHGDSLLVKAGSGAATQGIPGSAGVTAALSPQPVTDFMTARTSDTKKYAIYFKTMLQAGINLPPSQFEAQFLSFSHTDKDVVSTLKGLG